MKKTLTLHRSLSQLHNNRFSLIMRHNLIKCQYMNPTGILLLICTDIKGQYRKPAVIVTKYYAYTLTIAMLPWQLN